MIISVVYAQYSPELEYTSDSDDDLSCLCFEDIDEFEMQELMDQYPELFHNISDDSDDED